MKLGRLDAEISGSRLVLAGRIDDSAAALGDLVRHLPAGDVVIHTGGVTFVNSIGMREWMRVIRALRERGKVTFEAVADVLITQMNLIPEFKGVDIASFHAQYLCPKCGNEATPLVDVATYGAELRAMRAPKLPCPECGAAMDLGDFPERYLSLFRT
jgi:predicted RNA-binding Zn-ribbon protein involved in translation (DUF1610 family)